jgi:cytoskeletal protein RodZ
VIGRSRARTHSEQLMDELNESYGHLKMAAAHAAGGAAERFTPGYDRARNVASRRLSTTMDAFAPLYEQIREGAANARREPGMKRNKWPMVAGLIAAGAAVGAAGAMIARRRRVAAQWDEYEPMPSLEESPYGETKGSAAHRVTAGAASVADSVSSQAGKLADSLHERARSSGTSMGTSGSSMGTGESTFAPFAEPEAPPTKPSKATPKEPKNP